MAETLKEKSFSSRAPAAASAWAWPRRSTRRARWWRWAICVRTRWSARPPIWAASEPSPPVVDVRDACFGAKLLRGGGAGSGPG